LKAILSRGGHCFSKRQYKDNLEEIDHMLREHGVDTEEMNKILANGGGVITFKHIKHRRSH